MLESKYKTELIKRIKRMFSGCMVFHLDPDDYQGAPDLLILFEDKWAVLEGKRSANSAHQPNQDYYVDVMDEMSFAAFIYPENEEEVLYGLQQTFTPRRSTRVSKRK